MGEMGEMVNPPKTRPTADQKAFDTRNGNRELVDLLQEAGTGADGGRRSLAMGEAANNCGTASKHDINIDKKKTVIGALRIYSSFIGTWAQHLLIFIMAILGQGSIHLATTMLQNTSMQILSVFFVGLSWADVKYALGQTDYGCKVLGDPVAGKTSGNSFMVAMTLLASVIIGAVVAFWILSCRRKSNSIGVAFWVHSCHRKSSSMKVIDEVLKAGPPRMVRSDPNLVLPPAIEPWSGMY